MIVLPLTHRLTSRDQIEISDLAGERYVQRSFCEFNDVVDMFDARGVDCETVYRSDRDDWVLAMIASGFGFFPKYSDLEPRRRCKAAGQSGILAGSKPDNCERKAIFPCRRRACSRGDEVGVAGRCSPRGQESFPIRIATRKPDCDRPHPGYRSLCGYRHQLHLFMQDHA